MINGHLPVLVRLGRWFALFLGVQLAALGAVYAEEIQDQWSGVERVYAVGDVHGDYDGYLKVLKDAGVVNRRGNWSAGAAHLVQVGDVPDRGPSTDKIIRHLMKLEKQALKAGGRVHALIGNHEAMNMLGDLRYVHPGEYKALRSRNARDLRNGYYQRVVAYLQAREDAPEIDDGFRDQWMQAHPLGFVEHRQLWSANGEFGAWVLEHTVVIRINDTLFLHGGLGPSYAETSLREINERARSELANPAAYEDKLVEDDDGPLWHRGLSDPRGEEPAYLAPLLERHGVRRIVVGHTPGFGTVVPRLDAQVLVIDSGISAHYGGYQASLLIEGEDLYTLQGEERIPLPRTEEESLGYLRTMAERRTNSDNLRALIDFRERQLSALEEPVAAGADEAGEQAGERGDGLGDGLGDGPGDGLSESPEGSGSTEQDGGRQSAVDHRRQQLSGSAEGP